MRESYSGPSAGEMEATPAELARLRALLARLAPSADAALLAEGLLADARAEVRDVERDPAARELARVRAQLALGGAARMLQHDMSNPLTALLAEAQMLEMEPLADEARGAVGRVIELARRLAAITRGLDATGTTRIG